MKKKKVLITLSIVGIFILSFIIYNYINTDGIIIASGKGEESVNSKTFSLMLETSAGSGEYQMSTETSWPGSGYEYNETLSACENGSTLIWNEETRSVSLKANISDKCYLYFDIVPPDVTLATNNTDNAYNPSTPATLSCNGATSSYNQKYQRVEISGINNKYTNCTLTYQEPGNKTYLNDYIIDLSGTTQGTGELVHEIANIPDYTSALTESQYGTVSMYSNSSASSTSGTTTTGAFTYSGNEWSSVPSTMTSGTYYHFMFTPEESGNYQICYNISTGNSSNRLYTYVNTTAQYTGGNSYVSASTSSTISRCKNLGYISTSDYIKIVQYAYSSSSSSIATMSFSIEKANTFNEVDTGYRYEGKDPNNYIWFNNELWRIIGVFDESSHGINGQNLVKIIRADSIGGLAWNKNHTNDWTRASLMYLLNEAYFNSENATGTTNCAGYGSIGAQCNYTESGINDTYRPMIENVIWYLGGYYDHSVTVDTFYTAERGDTVYSGRPTSTTGYIGLMYPSDYGYSVLASSCARTTNLRSYHSTSCAGQSWLYGQGFEWTITPYLTRGDFVYIRDYHGELEANNHFVYFGHVVRPVLYLDSSVYVIDGNGSISDPYIIGM